MVSLFDHYTQWDYPLTDVGTLTRNAASEASKKASSKSSNDKGGSKSGGSSGKSVAKADTSDIDAQIKLLRDAMKEASGFKRRELEARLEEAKLERESRIEAARIGADASRYGSDKQLEGTKYSSDAGERNSQRSLQGQMYSADSSAAASRYGTDADLYKFAAEQPLKRGEQALSFLKNYTDLSARPDSWLQASNYGRLGYQVEGMPAMMADLLGNVNPNGQPVGGNIAFRAGTADMPVTAAQAIFGDNPLNLGTRAEAPPAPVWMGPQGQGGSYNPGLMGPVFANGVGAYGASYGSGDHRGKIVSDSYGAQGGVPMYTTPVPQTQQLASAQQPTGGFVPPEYLTNSQPRIMTEGVVPQDSSAEEQYVASVRQLMQRGPHQLGQQSLERMTQTERDMLASGIKAAGGVPQDFFEGYARSRIGNEGSGRAL